MSLLDQALTFDALKKEFDGASDRASAVIAGAFLDALLTELLRHFFVEDIQNDKKLFDGTGPLSSFSAKIEIAYRVGLMSLREHHALHTIRSIRNDFAHQFGDLSFSDQSVRDRCKNIETPLAMLPPEFPCEGETPPYKFVKADTNDAQACFQESVISICHLLTARLQRLFCQSVVARQNFRRHMNLASKY